MRQSAMPLPATVAENLRAILLLVLSMGLFAIEDTFIKLAAREIGTGQIMLILGAAGGCFFLAYAFIRGQKMHPGRLMEPALLTRNTGEVIGSLGFITALSLIPLSTASAILQATPLAVTMGAALFLGEAVGWRRWLAVLVGFTGVMIIIRPGLSGFDANALFAVVGVLGLATRDVATRRLPRDLPTSLVSASAFGALVPAAIGLMVFTGGWRPVSLETGIYLVCCTGVGIVGYYSITAAMRMGETSVIAPFRYTRLVFALIVGFIVFAERPDVWMYTGSAIVIATGLYAFHRERVVNRRR